MLTGSEALSSVSYARIIRLPVLGKADADNLVVFGVIHALQALLKGVGDL